MILEGFIMNKKLVQMLILSLFLNQIAHTKRVLINKIIARVNGTNILKSDLEKPRIVKNGGTYTFSELFFEEIMFQHAIAKKIVPTEAEINRQIISLKIQNGMNDMSDEDFEKELNATGFSMQEYKLELARVLAVENLKRAEISEKIVITSQQVEQYYKEHPDYSPEQYNISLSVLSEDNAKRYKDAVKNKEVTWIDLGWVNLKDIDTQYNFVSTMNPKTISKPIAVDDSYRLIKLNDRKDQTLKTLNERYHDIERRLHRTLQDEIFENFQSKIKEKATLTKLT